jgi:hypothetical protein
MRMLSEALRDGRAFLLSAPGAVPGLHRPRVRDRSYSILPRFTGHNELLMLMPSHEQKGLLARIMQRFDGYGALGAALV